MVSINWRNTVKIITIYLIRQRKEKKHMPDDSVSKE